LITLEMSSGLIFRKYCDTNIVFIPKVFKSLEIDGETHKSRQHVLVSKLRSNVFGSFSSTRLEGVRLFYF